MSAEISNIVADLYRPTSALCAWIEINTSQNSGLKMAVSAIT
jgi:hypothetical protein